MTLRALLLRRIALILLATLVMGAILITWHARFKVETEMRAAFGVGNRITANALSEERTIVEPRRYLERLIATFDGDRHLRASLLGADGVPLLESKLLTPDVRTPDWLYRQLAGKPIGTIVPLPLVLKPEGSLVLETDSRNEVAEAANDARLYLLILAGFCGSVALLLQVTLGSALRPLQQLTAACEQLGNGDYRARVAVSQPSEMAHLASGFNAMAGRLAGAEERNTRLREQLDTVQEEERAELARNLHDEVSPLLFSVDVDATTIRRLAQSEGPAAIAGRAEAILQAVAEIKGNVRAVLSQLRPTQMAALTLRESLEYRVAVWSARHPTVAIHLAMDEDGWGSSIDGAVHNIVRESVSNALRHGRPTRIDIRISERAGRHLAVEIADDGGGLDPGEAGRGGFGILGMYERAERLGGTFKHGNRHDGTGVTVLAELPIQAKVAVNGHQTDLHP